MLYKYDNKYKVPLKRLLIGYYKISLNPKLNFSAPLLEQLGFKKCYSCKKRTA